MDWSKCIICGKAGSDLKCPQDSLQNNGPQVYNNFLEVVEKFNKIGAIPVKIQISSDVTANELTENKAKWHKSYHLKFSSSKLFRAQAQLERGKKHKLETTQEEQRKSKRQASAPNQRACIFCKIEAGKLHQCSTMGLDQELRKMATELQDTALLSLLSGGDLVAIEAKYHYSCLTAYKNKHRSMQRALCTTSDTSIEDNILQARAFAELISYIEGNVDGGSYIFKLSELHALYENRLQDLGINKTINKTRLKTQLLGHFFGECQEESDGRNVLLVFKQGLKRLLKESLDSRDFESEALLICKVAKIIRKEIFQWKNFHFTGYFPPNCQNDSVPTLLRCLISMLINGPNVKNQDSTESQACLTISQLIFFNAKKISDAVRTRHCKDREPPLPIYLGLQIHTLTRSRKLVNSLYKLGISVSYNHVNELENLLANAVCERYEAEGLVCPANLRIGLLTVGVLDNIDHNPSSTTAQGSFHGTGISVFQFPTSTNHGVSREAVLINSKTSNSSKCSLPQHYTNVQDLTCQVNTITVPESAPMNKIQGNLDAAKEEEMKWIDHGMQLLEKHALDKQDSISWAAFHASLQRNPSNLTALISLLPLFYEKASTLAMIKHGMDILKKITDYLNPQQIPVIALDQPLFALAKYVQWQWPETHGEGNFVVMFGGLHIEMSLWNAIGDFLEDSGWTVALNDAGIASSGTADSFLKAAHLTRTRHAHQVSMLALAKLQREAWQKFASSNSDDISFEMWQQNMSSKSPTFLYWDLILEFEMMTLIFIRAHRINNFNLYVESLENLVPWFFVLDHTNYSRWIPIHIRDMQSLPDSISDEFRKCWVLQKTQHVFSCMPLDQGHEQNNEMVKGSGGVVGITENPTAFKKWMTAGPEQARLLKEFEQSLDLLSEREEFDWLPQHEQCVSIQQTFKNHVQNLTETISNFGNPFLDDCSELVALDTRNCVSEDVAETVQTIKDLGVSQYKEFVKDVIVTRKVSIHQPIKKIFLPLFKRPVPRKRTGKGKREIASLRSDCNLFSHLYIASKFRDGDLEDFFAHENQPWPPSLSGHGKLRLPTKKSDLLSLLDTSPTPEPPSYFQAKMIDGPAIVHILPCKLASTFEEYSENVFIAWIKKELMSCDRIDIIWDIYKEGSLKESTREKRGKGIRRKVSSRTKLPTNFKDFLRDSLNKQELFDFLTCKISSHDFPAGKTVYATSGSSIISQASCQTINHTAQPCDHEEADTRIALHLYNAMKSGARNLLVRTVDTDVIVILVGLFSNFHPATDIWVAFGTGKSFRYYHINSICQALGSEKSKALLFFHAYTGCDTTSQFLGKGKKSAWDAWKAYPEVTVAFLSICEQPFRPLMLDSRLFAILERFTCVLYDKSSTLTSVNELRQELFSRKSKLMEYIPPTQAALLQHCNRALYQSSIWAVSLQNQQNAPLPDKYGWQKMKSVWVPIWTLLPEAAKASRELLKCGCKAVPLCSRKCRCREAGLPCTGLCQCGGKCDN